MHARNQVGRDGAGHGGGASAGSRAGGRWRWLAMAVILGGAFQAAAPQASAHQASGGGAAQAPASAQPWRTSPAGELARPLMPDPSLEPPANQVPVLVAYGVGVQRYVCKEKEAAKSSFEWTLKEPQAKLADAGGHELGSHSAGPSWQLADGSKAVKKKLIASMAALQADAVPWLLIEIESSGKGSLSGTQYVQRVDTIGGVAPATGCDQAHAGTTHDVEYRATYVFYAPRKP